MTKVQNKIYVCLFVCVYLFVCVTFVCLREGRKESWVNDKEIEEKCKTLENLDNGHMGALYTILGTFLHVWNCIEIKGNDGSLNQIGSGACHKKQISVWK